MPLIHWRLIFFSHSFWRNVDVVLYCSSRIPKNVPSSSAVIGSTVLCHIISAYFSRTFIARRISRVNEVTSDVKHIGRPCILI